jgi:UDP-glucose 4-epimerase
MKYLVTGDCGFIGGNLAQRLLKDGHTVYGYDDYSSSVRKDRIAGVKPLADMEKTDGIFHLGMSSSSPMYRNPLAITNSIRTTLKVVELANACRSPVVFASSSSLYNGNPVPYDEFMEIRPSDLYTETRLFIERIFEMNFHREGLSSIGLRLFSVFGPRDAKKGKYANNITQFAKNILKGEELTVYGDGKQTRDFIHVDHVVEAFLKAMEWQREIRCHDIINVGTGKSLSFNDMISILHLFLKTKGKVTYVRNPIKNYVQHTLADTNRMKEKLFDPSGIDFEGDLKRHLDNL